MATICAATMLVKRGSLTALITYRIDHLQPLFWREYIFCTAMRYLAIIYAKAKGIDSDALPLWPAVADAE
jgi:hypothetical protein